MPMNHVKILSILVSLQRETKPGGFLRGKYSSAPLNSTGYTALTPIAFFSAYCFKNQYLPVRAVYSTHFNMTKDQGFLKGSVLMSS